MQIIKGGKEPEPTPEDTTIKDMMLTQDDLDRFLKEGSITMTQYDKLSEEVPHSDN